MDTQQPKQLPRHGGVRHRLIVEETHQMNHAYQFRYRRSGYTLPTLWWPQDPLRLGIERRPATLLSEMLRQAPGGCVVLIRKAVRRRDFREPPWSCRRSGEFLVDVLWIQNRS